MILGFGLGGHYVKTNQKLYIRILSVMDQVSPNKREI